MTPTRANLLDENIRKRKSAGQQHNHAFADPGDFLGASHRGKRFASQGYGCRRLRVCHGNLQIEGLRENHHAPTSNKVRHLGRKPRNNSVCIVGLITYLKLTGINFLTALALYRLSPIQMRAHRPHAIEYAWRLALNAVGRNITRGNRPQRRRRHAAPASRSSRARSSCRRC